MDDATADFAKIGGGGAGVLALRWLFSRVVRQSDDAQRRIEADLAAVRNLTTAIHAQLAVLEDREARREKRLEQVEQEIRELSRRTISTEIELRAVAEKLREEHES